MYLQSIWHNAWVDSISFYDLASEKERLMHRNPADIELKLVIDIE